jgi:hypothetical protein
MEGKIKHTTDVISVPMRARLPSLDADNILAEFTIRSTKRKFDSLQYLSEISSK